MKHLTYKNKNTLKLNRARASYFSHYDKNQRILFNENREFFQKLNNLNYIK